MVSTLKHYRSRAPMEHVERNPWSFLVLALATGLAAGALLRFKNARRALKWYLLFKRFV